MPRKKTGKPTGRPKKKPEMVKKILNIYLKEKEMTRVKEEAARLEITASQLVEKILKRSFFYRFPKE